MEGYPDPSTPESRKLAQGMGGWGDIRNALAQYRSGASGKPSFESLKGYVSAGISPSESMFMDELLKYMLEQSSGRDPYYKGAVSGPSIYDDPEVSGATPKGGSKYR